MSNSEREVELAYLVGDGVYSLQDVKLLASIQGLDFEHVEQVYARLYESEQCVNEGYCHA